MLFRRTVSEILLEQNRLTKHILQFFLYRRYITYLCFLITQSVAQDMQH